MRVAARKEPYTQRNDSLSRAFIRTATNQAFRKLSLWTFIRRRHIRRPLYHSARYVYAVTQLSAELVQVLVRRSATIRLYVKCQRRHPVRCCTIANNCSMLQYTCIQIPLTCIRIAFTCMRSYSHPLNMSIMYNSDIFTHQKFSSVSALLFLSWQR